LSQFPNLLVTTIFEVWQNEFQDKLRIRFKTHHSKCSQCLRHRLIIRKLGHCPEARRSQVSMLKKHLDRQHRDRQVYWAARGRSRLEAKNPYPLHITAILDSMDAQKHSWPRSKNMNSKEFCSFTRPRLTSTSLIIHGHSITLALSPSTLTSNSSRTSEILAHGLTLLSRKLDMRGAHLSLQGDNCCKEVKNNGQLRLLGCWIASGKLKSADLSFLSSGHSHEDVDAMFGAIRGFLESEPELHTPQAFQQHLAKFFDEPTRRPHEKDRHVVMLTQYRDWPLDSGFKCYSNVFVFTH
jgi:hypothetical protein